MPKAKATVVRLPIILRELEVLRVSDVSPLMRRVTLGGAQLKAFEADGRSLPEFRSEGPDDHVKILLPPADGGPFVLPVQREGVLEWTGSRTAGRSYTPRRYDPESGELHLDFVLHGHGPAGQWAAGAKPGDVLHIAGPKSSLLVPEADWYLLAGDETALPAVANWLECLPRDARVTAFIQISSPQAKIAIDAPRAAEVVWLEDAALAAETLPDAVRGFTFPPGEGFVWGAGEREAVKLLRRHLLEDRGLDKSSFDVVAYWHKGVEDGAREAAHHRLHELVDLLAPHAVRVATTLRLPDHIAAGATSVPVLAERAGADRRGLELLVPVLLDYGVLEGTPDALKLGLIGQMLREDQHDFDDLDLNGAPARMDLAWAGLLHAVQTGSPGYPKVFGQPFWADIAGNATLGASFTHEMGVFADYWSAAVAPFIEPGADGRISDVGGGNGTLLAALLRLNPATRGVLVELPTALEAARPLFAAADLADRVDLVAQSFFEPLPAAGAQVLSQVLHGWPDAEAVRILTRAAEAAGPDGSVFVVERHHDPATGRANAETALRMFVLNGGRERSAEDMHALAQQAGLVPVSAREAGPALVVYRYRRG